MRPGRLSVPVEVRFWPKVRKRSDGCWEWTAYTDPGGYGRIRVDGQSVLAHRLAYEMEVGPIPEGLQIDHLCRNRACQNPDHMEPVTQAENIRRGAAGKATGLQNRSKTHCPQGHPYSGENLYVNPRGQRLCRTCGRESCRASWARKKESRAS